MSHNHHNDPHYIQSLYEGDQSKLYSGIMSHHSDLQSDESRNQVKKIWKVTGILSVITIVEVFAGLTAHGMGVPKGVIAFFFLVLTVLKAAYIVRVFMHLGDEVKWFKFCVLIPLTLFIWFIIAFISDGDFWLKINHKTPSRIDYNHSATVDGK